MKKRLLTTLSLIALAISVQAQDDAVFSFNVSNAELDLAEVANEPIPTDPFSEDIGMMMTILKNNYTYEIPPSPTNPSPTTVVEKPTIYFAVKKVHKGFKKMVKQGDFTNEEAISRLSDVIQRAVNVRYQETVELEEALKDKSVKKDPLLIEDIFKKIEFNY
jgi:hypothetical protein